ncbi:hypothetical protein [Rhizobium leguminosarum]|uniref:hypothetical protein n=1 Tax=Rhizobium leguminosarum TaxID=384 RepID=UPI0013D9289A|nr:hypothetical protein [Rhizobium leguminosarum]NEK38697.1 hypothetical protein [Rhizobium leguminosarum]
MRVIERACWLSDEFEPVFHYVVIHADRQKLVVHGSLHQMRGSTPEGKLSQILLKLNTLSQASIQTRHAGAFRKNQALPPGATCGLA